jgi:hypothetical protein
VLVDLNLSQILEIFELLTQTYPRYVDARSRGVVEEIGMELVRRDELRGISQDAGSESKLGVAEQILGWLASEVGRMSRHGPSRSSDCAFS